MESGILSSSTALLPPTPRTLELPRRPDFGSLGRPIVVQANLYPISSLSLGSMTLYRVSITPTSSARTNRRVFEAWCKETLVNETHFPVFDGKETVYSASPLPQDIVDQARFDLTLTPDTSGTYVTFMLQIIGSIQSSLN